MSTPGMMFSGSLLIFSCKRSQEDFTVPDVRHMLNNREYIKKEDSTLRNVAHMVNNREYTKKEYILSKKAFKLSLMRAQNSCEYADIAGCLDQYE